MIISIPCFPLLTYRHSLIETCSLLCLCCAFEAIKSIELVHSQTILIKQVSKSVSVDKTYLSVKRTSRQSECRQSDCRQSVANPFDLLDFFDFLGFLEFFGMLEFFRMHDILDILGFPGFFGFLGIFDIFGILDILGFFGFFGMLDFLDILGVFYILTLKWNPWILYGFRIPRKSDRSHQ